MKRVELTCANDDVQTCNLVIAEFIANYEKQVVIISIKTRIQYHKCKILSGKRENLCKKWPLQMYKKLKAYVQR